MTIARRFALLSAAVVLLSLPQSTFGQEKTPCDACSVVTWALTAAKRLDDPGMTRADVEAEFVMDGGFQTADTTRYVFKKCHSIQILVRFEGNALGQFPALLPTDRIITVSRPYLEFQAMD